MLRRVDTVHRSFSKKVPPSSCSICWLRLLTACLLGSTWLIHAHYMTRRRVCERLTHVMGPQLDYVPSWNLWYLDWVRQVCQGISGVTIFGCRFCTCLCNCLRFTLDYNASCVEVIIHQACFYNQHIGFKLRNLGEFIMGGEKGAVDMSINTPVVEQVPEIHPKFTCLSSGWPWSRGCGGSDRGEGSADSSPNLRPGNAPQHQWLRSDFPDDCRLGKTLCLLVEGWVDDWSDWTGCTPGLITITTWFYY